MACENKIVIVNPHYKKLSGIFRMPLGAFRHQKDYHLTVPCGHCPDCLKRRTKRWALRADYVCESLGIDFSDCYFCTFTIKPELYGEVLEKPYLAIRRFLDRFRKHPKFREKNPDTGRYCYRKVKFPYFFVVEFADGETAKKRGLPSSHRMHFHAIFFGCPLYPYEVEELWSAHVGRADVQRCDSEAGIFYVLKYISKDNEANQYISDIDARKNGKLYVSHGFGRLLPEDVDRYRSHMLQSDSSYFSAFIGNYRYPISRYWKNKCFSGIEIKELNSRIVPKFLYNQIFVDPLPEYRSLSEEQKWEVYAEAVKPFLSDDVYSEYLTYGINVLKSAAK